MLVDYRGAFYSSMRNVDRLCSMDISAISRHFDDSGYRLVVKPFSSVDFRKDAFAGKHVLYQSSEDPGLHYKSYIEDILLGLDLQGAILIPRFPLFRAHHNKAFMEILRDLSENQEIKNVRSRVYGTFEEFEQDSTSYPTVLKTSDGGGSVGVTLLRGERDKRRYGKRFSKAGGLEETIRERLKAMLWRDYPPRSVHRKKFVAQNHIPNLQGDFKVLVFADKYYVLYRRNRTNDFRASGSGLFEHPESVPPIVLDFAKSVFESFQVPIISLDVALNGTEPCLIEFQCLHFGPLTLEDSRFCFVLRNGVWTKVDGQTVLEKEFVRSIVAYIENDSKNV